MHTVLRGGGLVIDVQYASSFAIRIQNIRNLNLAEYGAKSALFQKHNRMVNIKPWNMHGFHIICANLELIELD